MGQSLESCPGEWACPQGAWALEALPSGCACGQERGLIADQGPHPLHIYLPSDSYVSHTLFLDEFTIHLFYHIGETLRMRGLERAGGLRWGK